MTRSRLKALCWLALLLAEPSWLAAAEPAASAEGRVWRKPSDVFLSTLATLDEQPPNLEYSELRLKMGDDPRWAQATWDDRDWPEMPTYSSIPVRRGIFWLRYRLRGGEPGERLPSGYLITIVAAYELYWDGHRIGESGRPANTEAEEVPGPLDRIFEIPISLRGEGEHVLALRMSSHRSGFPSPTTYLQCFSGSPAYLAKLFLPLSIVPASAAATMAVLALVTVLLWLMATRRAALPWFFGLCLSIAIMQGLLAMRFITAYNYDWAYPMVLTRSILAGVIGFFLLAFVLVHFDLSRRRWWILMLVAAYGIASYSPQNRAGTHEATLLLTALGMALLVTARAAFVERRKHAWWVALGILATIILGLMRTRAFGLGEFVPRFLPTALCLLTVAWIQVLAERRQAREAQLNSARLEIELLKKIFSRIFFLIR